MTSALGRKKDSAAPKGVPVDSVPDGVEARRNQTLEQCKLPWQLPLQPCSWISWSRYVRAPFFFTLE